MNWHRSTFCTASECAEIAVSGQAVLIRDSADPAGPVLTFTAGSWRALIARVKDETP